MKQMKDIPIRFTASQVGTATIEKVITYYKMGVPISGIIKRINPGRARHETLSFVDVYAIINDARTKNKCQQRQLPKNELSIDQFKKVFTAWKAGSTVNEMYEMIVNNFKKPRYHIESVLRSLNTRWRETKKKAGRKRIATSQDMMQKTLLDFAERMMIDDRRALVIFFDKIPPNMLDELEGLSDFHPMLSLETKTEDEVQRDIHDIPELSKKQGIT